MSDEPSGTAKTAVGSYFISNYPPFSQWSAEQLGELRRAFESPPADVPLGLYIHIPFCRKRCKFCYFKVFTEKNAREIETYMAALAREIELVSRLPVMGDRPFRFVYFGGGTPSFLSSRQLTSLVDRLRANIDWSLAEEVTFECEPGTLSLPKLQTIRDVGVTRLSLGIENYNDHVLETNGRAHLSAEIYRAWDWITSVAFPNVNIDLIAGMIGETWENWKDNVRRAIDMSPESITVYQMELPYNTVISRQVLQDGQESPIADWDTKRAWVDYAFDEFLAAGYHISSAYTVVKDPTAISFSYRDNLWQGADMLATGVASFGHVSGVHYQNLAEWSDYVERLLERGELPLGRALKTTELQRMIREMILQLKRGFLDRSYFRSKFGTDVLDQWQSEWEQLRQDGMVQWEGDQITLTRRGLLQADGLLPMFFEPEYRGVRYT